MPNQTTSEDGERKSLAETVKNLFNQNKKIITFGVTALAVATAVVILAKGQYVAEETEDVEPSPDPVAEDQKRQPPCKHEVSAYERVTKYGIQTVRSHSRGGSTA